MSKATWGDTVRIKETASAQSRPGSLAAVCGIRDVQIAEIANLFNCQIGTFLYLVEFSDGTSIELPESLVEPVIENNE